MRPKKLRTTAYFLSGLEKDSIFITMPHCSFTSLYFQNHDQQSTITVIAMIQQDDNYSFIVESDQGTEELTSTKIPPFRQENLPMKVSVIRSNMKNGQIVEFVED